jgi:Rrf2 family nitric oxide-sensitive transcriptional repressor
LARSPKDISLADVIRDMEPSFDIVECFSSSSNTCRISRACGLKAVLEEATRAFLSTLEKYSLSDVIRDEKFLKRALVGATKSPSNKGTNAEMRNEMT